MDTALSPERLLAVIRFQTEIVKAGLDLGEVVQRTAQLAQELCGGGGAVVEMVDGADMVYRAASGRAAALLGLRLPRQGTLSGLCVERGVTLVCADSESDPRVDRATCRRLGLRSLAAAPLRHSDEVVGVLKVGDARPDAFDPADLAVLDLVTEVVGAAMAHATLFAGTRDQARELYHRATRDALTGLANRALFSDHLQSALARAARERTRLGIAMVDMDGLKAFNDTYGHSAGDEAIRTLARRLSWATRQADTVARLGGDEFAVLLTSVTEDEPGRDLAERLALRLEGPFQWQGQDLPLGASVGVALFPGHGSGLEALVDYADREMYRMKERRRGRGAGARG